MRVIFFFIVMVGIIVGAFYYLNRENGVTFDPNSEYCKNLENKVRTGDYQISYGERAKSLLYGCL